jgi:Flp pilus assembly protein TadG
MTKRARLKAETGQSIIEITLITPLLLIALYIPADFGVAFFMGNLTQTAVREGARIGSGITKTAPKGSDDWSFDAKQATTVKEEVKNRLPALLKNKSVTVTFYTGTECMEFIEVTADGEYNFFLYQLIRLLGATAPDSLTISRTTQMRYTYQPFKFENRCTTSKVF